MNINKHIPRAYKTAIKRGFFTKCIKCDGEGSLPMGAPFKAFTLCELCNGSGIDQNIPISKLIMDVIEEVAEARKAYRLQLRELGKTSISAKCPDEDYIYYYNEYFKDTFESELADIIITILSICGYYNLSLEYIKRRKNIKIDKVLSLVCFQLSELIYSEVGNMPFTYGNIENSLSGAYSLILNYCNKENIDIEKHIKLKMKYNELRGE